MITMTTMEHSTQGPTSESQLHLYLAWGCPFCHRVLAALVLTGLSELVTCTWMRNIKGVRGWEISPGDDPVFGEKSLHCVYRRLAQGAEHKASVPLLVDLSSNTLLSSNSAQITRFFTLGMNSAQPVDRELAPGQLVEQIDNLNAWLHDNVNRAVYKVGFATEQADYDEKARKLFRSLDELDSRLAAQPYLFGQTLTESDLYLWATLKRFDRVYYPLFKCSYRRIAEYRALTDYTDRITAIDGMHATYNHRLTREHYFCSVMHVRGEVRDLNPSRIIPVDSWHPEQLTNEIRRISPQ